MKIIRTALAVAATAAAFAFLAGCADADHSTPILNGVATTSAPAPAPATEHTFPVMPTYAPLTQAPTQAPPATVAPTTQAREAVTYPTIPPLTSPATAAPAPVATAAPTVPPVVWTTNVVSRVPSLQVLASRIGATDFQVQATTPGTDGFATATLNGQPVNLYVFTTKALQDEFAAALPAGSFDKEMGVLVATADGTPLPAIF